MLLRSGRTKNKMANSKQVQPDQEIEPNQEHFNLEEVSGLLNPETTTYNARGRQSATVSSTGTIPKQFRKMDAFYTNTCQSFDFYMYFNGKMLILVKCFFPSKTL